MNEITKGSYVEVLAVADPGSGHYVGHVGKVTGISEEDGRFEVTFNGPEVEGTTIATSVAPAQAPKGAEKEAQAQEAPENSAEAPAEEAPKQEIGEKPAAKPAAKTKK